MNEDQARSDLEISRANFHEYATRAHLYMVGLAFSVLGLAINSVPQDCKGLGQETEWLYLLVGSTELMAWVALLVAGLCGIWAFSWGVSVATENFEISKASFHIAQFGPTPPGILELPDGKTMSGRDFEGKQQEARRNAAKKGARAAEWHKRCVAGLLWLLVLGLLLLAVARSGPQIYRTWGLYSRLPSVDATTGKVEPESR